MFTSTFALDQPARGGSAFGGAEGAPGYPAPGRYNGGELTVLDAALGATILSDWQWLFAEPVMALVLTAFGDVIVWRPSVGFGFLAVQRGAVAELGADTDALLNRVLPEPAIRQRLFRLGDVSEVAARTRPLNFGEVYILEPWEMFGGAAAQSPYHVGGAVEYLSLVGQTHDVEVVVSPQPRRPAGGLRVVRRRPRKSES